MSNNILTIQQFRDAIIANSATAETVASQLRDALRLAIEENSPEGWQMLALALDLAHGGKGATARLLKPFAAFCEHRLGIVYDSKDDAIVVATVTRYSYDDAERVARTDGTTPRIEFNANDTDAAKVATLAMCPINYDRKSLGATKLAKRESLCESLFKAQKAFAKAQEKFDESPMESNRAKLDAAMQAVSAGVQSIREYDSVSSGAIGSESKNGTRHADAMAKLNPFASTVEETRDESTVEENRDAA